MKKTLNSILLVVLISVFAFTGTIMTAKAPPPKAEFFITLSWISGSVEEKVENEQIRIYKLNQSWVITEANILLDNGIEGGHIDFSWLVVHVKQMDVAHSSGQFKITLIDGTVLVTVEQRL